MNNNINLQNAKNTKDDEFYTTYECVEDELSHYTNHFYKKTVLCNCDDPFESNFCKYFLRYFNRLGLSRLICTSFASSKMVATQLSLFDMNDKSIKTGAGYVLDVKNIGNSSSTDILSDVFVSDFLKSTKCIKKLQGDGDFRGSECLAYLDDADIVVTNPPFSLFKEIVSLLVKKNKKYLLIGNQNALTYKEIFPLIQNNEVWTGYRFGDMRFRVPADSEPRSTRYWVDETGQKWRSLGNAMWLTNLENGHHNEFLTLTKSYNPTDYPRFDTYDAINVSKCADIPYDYAGIMAVPITIIDKYNPEQFEIIGEANHGSDNEYDLFKPVINGKLTFKKILIKNKKLKMNKIFA